MTIWTLILLVIFLLVPFKVNAQADYVLPYPSAMPGSPFYRISLVKDDILKLWYFGDIGQFKYNLKMSDKYLVEAKTLFEYKQYLLATNALSNSNLYFKKINPKFNLSIYNSAKEKHIEVLKKTKNDVPKNFLWRPEKEKETNLNLWEIIENSIAIRQ